MQRTVKWLIYTVLVGLIPIICRFLVWIATLKGFINPLSASDFVIFGLILHISNINEIEHIKISDKSWKTIINGTSIAFISFYSVLFSLTLLGTTKIHIINLKTLLNCSIVLGIISFLISYAVYYRISKLEGKK